VFVTITKSDGQTLEFNTDHVVLIDKGPGGDPGRVVVTMTSGKEWALTTAEAAPLVQAIRDKIARGE
jgi:hypothetical protein